MKPYTDVESVDNIIIRRFDESIEPIELMWHRDDEDRLIELAGESDWLIQIDNELPRFIDGKVKINRHEWHRLIKGTGVLTLKITKLPNEGS